MRQEHLNRWKTYKGCYQSKTLMSEPLPSRTKELQAMSRQKVKVAVVLLPCHRTCTAHMFKLRLAQWQDCQLCGDKREDSVHTVCHCLALACKRYRTLGLMFLKSKRLENMRVNGLISLTANIRPGITP